MFTPPTERELKSFSQDSDDNNNNNNDNNDNNNDDSSIKLSNVVNSKYLIFQENKNKNEDENKDKNKNGFIFFNHHKNDIIKNDNKFFSVFKKEENRSSSFVNIENDKTNSRDENDDNESNTELNFWNFRSIFQTKKVSFPLQKEKKKKSKNFSN